MSETDKLSSQRFAQLLTIGVHRIRIYESKMIQIVQDELGGAIGRKGSAVIEYWRKGHLPPKSPDVEVLAREIVRRGRMDKNWLEEFLRSSHHPAPDELCEELFPNSTQAQPSEPQASEAPVEEAQNTQSPFVVGPPILQPRQFFGRNLELDYIFNLWQHTPLQHLALIGLRRSGKTSLLHFLKFSATLTPAQLRPGQRADRPSLPAHCRLVFVDFQDARMCNQQRLLQHLLTGLGLPIPEPCDLYHFMDVVSQNLKSPSIILMDELDAALASPELDQQFWWSLRSLCNNYTNGLLGFILSSHQAPAALAQERDKSSPFFNIFGHTLQLGPLTPPEALELIASSPQSFSAEAVEWIMSQSGGWPSLLQILCQTRLQALENDGHEAAWQEEGLRRMTPYQYLLHER